MAKPLNALAPVPANALYERAQTYPEFQELARYLGPAMPTIRYGAPAELMGASGQFNPLRARELAVAERLGYPGQEKAADETVMHELTHAAINKLHWAYQDAKKNRGSDAKAAQFADAYEKLLVRPDFISQASVLASRISPEWTKSKKDYRASGAELPAWAMGLSATNRTDDYGAPAHINPTLAAELRILLDLATRAQVK